MASAAGVLCNEDTAEQIAATGLVETLFGHMGAKKDDDEFVLQLTFTFSKLLSFEATAASLLQNTDILYYLVDLLQDKNKEVCISICLQLDVSVLAAHDSDLTCRGGSICECSPRLRLDFGLHVMPGRGTGHFPCVFLSVVAVCSLLWLHYTGQTVCTFFAWASMETTLEGICSLARLWWSWLAPDDTAMSLLPSCWLKAALCTLR